MKQSLAIAVLSGARIIYINTTPHIYSAQPVSIGRKTEPESNKYDDILLLLLLLRRLFSRVSLSLSNPPHIYINEE